MGRIKQLAIEAQEVLDWNQENMTEGLEDDTSYGVMCLVSEIKELRECEDMAESLFIDWHEKTFARKPRQESTASSQRACVRHE